MSKVFEKLKQLSVQEWLELIFYPVVLIYRMPVAWFHSLWAARILLNGQWHQYMGFNPQNALNSFFYRTQWLNVDRYGRRGVSPVIGLGNYPLSRWFHLSPLSSYLFANAGAVTTLLGTLVWVFTHLIWMESTLNPFWVIAVTVTLFFSSTAYSMAFARQNYQILAWMWMPLALYSVMNAHWVMAAFAWFAASLAGITVIFFAIPLMLVYAVANEKPEAFLVLIPSFFSVATQFIPSFVSGSLKKDLLNVGKLIGAVKKKVKYKRMSMRLDIVTLYFSIINVVVCSLLWWFQGVFPLIPFVTAYFFFINNCVLRVADIESMFMMNVTVLCAQVISSPSLVAIMILWLAVTPLPLFMGITTKKNMMRIAKQPPFNHASLESGLEKLFSAIPSGSRIMLAFEDPKGVYENIFDGYRVLLELPLYVAAKRGIHLFPDWYAVGETNYEGSPDIWGRIPHAVDENIREWNAQYALVYQDRIADLNEEWKAVFEIIGVFDWSDYEIDLSGYSIIKGGLHFPVFILLGRKGSVR